MSVNSLAMAGPIEPINSGDSEGGYAPSVCNKKFNKNCHQWDLAIGCESLAWSAHIKISSSAKKKQWHWQREEKNDLKRGGDHRVLHLRSFYNGFNSSTNLLT